MKNILFIKEYDFNGNIIYYKDSNGFEYWYDSNGKVIHYKNSDGYEQWYEYASNGNIIHWWNSKGIEQWWDSDGYPISKEQYDILYGTHA